MNIGDCIKAYIKLSGKVFTKKHCLPVKNPKGRLQAKFDTKALEQAIKDIVLDSGLEENALLKELESRCKV